MANSFTVNTYSAKDVILTIGGYQIGGWQSIAIQRNQKAFTTVRGVGGKNTRVANKDTSATLNITLMASSPTNDVFSEIVDSDIGEKTARVVFTLKDLSGNSVFSSSEAYFTGYPPKSFTAGIGDVTWEVFAQTSETFRVAGNSRPSTSLFDSAINEASNFINSL